MNAPIRVRMTAGYVVLLAAIIAAVGAFVVIRLRADLTSAIDRSLRSTIPQIAIGYSVEGLPEFRDKSNSLLAGERTPHRSGPRRALSSKAGSERQILV